LTLALMEPLTIFWEAPPNMPGQFDNETTCKNFEWHRERALREAKNPNATSLNRVEYNLKAIEAKHGTEAAREVLKEYNSKVKRK
jgi:hypothetical protein